VIEAIDLKDKGVVKKPSNIGHERYSQLEISSTWPVEKGIREGELSIQVDDSPIADWQNRRMLTINLLAVFLDTGLMNLLETW
jgi:hypothetical protein